MNNSPKIIFPNEFKHNEVMFENPKSDNNNGNGGGGNMSYVSQETFNQYEKRIDGQLDGIDTSIKDMKSTLKWAVGLAATTLIAVVIGFITVIFNII